MHYVWTLVSKEESDNFERSIKNKMCNVSFNMW